LNKTFDLKYGKGTISFDLPEEAVLEEIRGWHVDALPDLGKAYRHALEHPIDAPPLREIVRPGQTVAISVSDITRAWQRNDLTLPILIETLNEAGVPDDHITVIIAVGGHRANTQEEFTELCGEEICHRVRVVNHDARDDSNMVYLGKTSRGTRVSVNRIAMEADRFILTGGVIYHYMAGYGGGRKSVLPGVSALKTIQQNHVLALGKEIGSGSNPMSASGITRGNALHEDMMEITAFVQPDFIVNIVPNLNDEIAAVFGGNWVSAWQDAAALADRIFGVPIRQQADIVIATAGGYPKDINLYQTGKTMDNACYAMKEGGAAIILSECPNLLDPPSFIDWLRYPSVSEMDRALRRDFALEGWVALKQVECTAKGQIILLTRPENVDLLSGTGFTAAGRMEEALSIAYKKCGTKNPKITIMPQGALTLPILNI
jgi:nickel-dependent lactate racemase